MRNLLAVIIIFTMKEIFFHSKCFKLKLSTLSMLCYKIKSQSKWWPDLCFQASRNWQKRAGNGKVQPLYIETMVLPVLKIKTKTISDSQIVQNTMNQLSSFGLIEETMDLSHILSTVTVHWCILSSIKTSYENSLT